MPAELDVHLVCDNLATHKTRRSATGSTRHPRFDLHFTPTGSSWINQVERWFGLLTDQLIRRGVHTSDGVDGAVEGSVAAGLTVIECWHTHIAMNAQPMTSTSKIENDQVFPKARVSRRYGAELTNSLATLRSSRERRTGRSERRIRLLTSRRFTRSG